MNTFCVSSYVFDELMTHIENDNDKGTFYSENGISLTEKDGYTEHYRFQKEEIEKECNQFVSKSAKTINSVGAIHYYHSTNLSKTSQEQNKAMRTLFKEFQIKPNCNSAFSLFNINCKTMPWAYEMEWNKYFDDNLVYADVLQVGPCLTKGHLDQDQLAGISCIAPWIVGLEKVWFIVRNSLRYTNEQLLRIVRRTHHANGVLMTLSEQNDAQVMAYILLQKQGLIHIVVQKPGQVLYIPCGMAHAVLTSFDSTRNPSFVSLLIGASILTKYPTKSTLSTIACSLKKMQKAMPRKCQHLTQKQSADLKEMLQLKKRSEARRLKSRGPSKSKNHGRYVLSPEDRRRRKQVQV